MAVFRTLLLFWLGLFGLFLIGCGKGPTEVTGGTTDSGNAIVVGSVIHNLIPVINASVRIRPVGYLSVDDGSKLSSLNTKTDTTGRFLFELKESGDYILEVIKKDTLACVHTLSTQSGKNGIVNLSPLELARTGSLKGKISSKSNVAGLVKVAGLEHETRIKPDGSFRFQNLAPGTYNIVIKATNTDTLKIKDIKTVSAKESEILIEDIKKGKYQLIIPDTFYSDSLKLAAYLDKQKISKFYRFEDLITVIDNRIRTLDLQNLELLSLHPSIGTLDFLYTLNISYNSLKAIPPDIKGCRLLSAFLATNNLLTSLPPELGALKYLEFLKVTTNKLTTIPTEIYNLSRLRKFAIAENPVNSVSERIGNFKNLEMLDIYGCNLKTIPESIGQLTRLNQIWAANNQLTTLPHAITSLSKLETLQISYNNLTTLPDSINNLKSLTNLMLYENKLTNLPSSMVQLKQLKNLNVDNNSLCSLSPQLKSWLDTYATGDWLNDQLGCLN